MKEVVAKLCFTSGIMVGFYPLLYWFGHPTLTEMQVFLKFWPITLFSCLLLFAFTKLIEE